MTTSRTPHPPKVLVTKIGLDGHDRGSRVVAAFLRDAGMDVLYTPPWQEIAQVIRLAEEEDVDVIGISSLATDHLLVPKLMKALKKAQLEHIPVVVGGIVPDDDEKKLRKAGVRHVFHPGASREEIVVQGCGAGRRGAHLPRARRLSRDDVCARMECGAGTGGCWLPPSCSQPVTSLPARPLLRLAPWPSLPDGLRCAGRTAASTDRTRAPAEAGHC